MLDACCTVFQIYAEYNWFSWQSSCTHFLMNATEIRNVFSPNEIGWFGGKERSPNWSSLQLSPLLLSSLSLDLLTLTTKTLSYCSGYWVLFHIYHYRSMTTVYVANKYTKPQTLFRAFLLSTARFLLCNMQSGDWFCSAFLAKQPLDVCFHCNFLLFSLCFALLVSAVGLKERQKTDFMQCG